MANIDFENDVEVLDHKFVANCLDMISFQIDFLLRNANFGLYTHELFESVSALKTSLYRTKVVYSSQLKFDCDKSLIDFSSKCNNSKVF